MCELLVDVQIEADTVTASNDDALQLVCASGRVIIAATAWLGNTSTAKPIGVSLADGALTDACMAYPASSVAGSYPQSVHYSLTTARAVTL